ncbi:hypothetical protein [Pseudodonghicola flavimaris]|uniref:Glycoside hydrolase family 19 catalytic domain-containing protein n=1 Tax=Pseudodonghicola flavimaris TaxID=3050036 RepID=A0ABT7F842_9RHOB|nr:hypothetical protein [Pseudodonghicola flavimaris]MDK3020766.1 hypothetical protein [Pseudodonghicola flavimaris]
MEPFDEDLIAPPQRGAFSLEDDMDRSAFYAALRKRDSGIFGTALSQRQVDGLEALLDACAGLSLHHAAHVLGESYHETGGGMFPVKETVYRSSKDLRPSDATVIGRLEAAWRKGKLPWVRAPYWREGWFGRGVIQLTHADNYRRASALVGIDLVSHPEAALEPAISARIAAEGCATGLFTGRKLTDFDLPGGGYDHAAARAIVNGDARLNGLKVSGYAEAFERALRAAGWGVAPEIEPEPVEETDPTTAGPPAAATPSFFTALLRKILSILKGA